MRRIPSGEQINFTAVAQDAGFPPRTVREHYQILEDTLVGHRLPAYQKTTRRKPVATAKFYFFDVGVANILKRTGVIEEGSDAYGRALEHLIFLELRSFLDCSRLDHDLTCWRSRSQFEVDVVVGHTVGIEVKSKARVSPRDYKGLGALGEEVLAGVLIASYTSATIVAGVFGSRGGCDDVEHEVGDEHGGRTCRRCRTHVGWRRALSGPQRGGPPGGGPENGLNVSPPNGEGQKPAFAGQTRAPEHHRQGDGR